MALITCIECGKEVSSTAKACPHCGCPITHQSLSKFSEQGIPKKQNRKLSPLGIGIVIGCIFLIIIVGVTISNSSSQKNSYSSQSYEVEQQYNDLEQSYQEASAITSEVEAARDNYARELQNLSYKVNHPHYQGVLQQQLFWDCDDAFDEYERKVNKLIGYLRNHGFSNDDVQGIQDEFNQDKNAYYEFKRSVQTQLDRIY